MVISSIFTFSFSLQHNLHASTYKKYSIDSIVCVLSGFGFSSRFRALHVCLFFFLIFSDRCRSEYGENRKDFHSYHSSRCNFQSHYSNEGRAAHISTYRDQHRLSSRFWSSMQAGWCRSKNKPLISARLRLASERLPVNSSLGHQNYIKMRKVWVFCLFNFNNEERPEQLLDWEENFSPKKIAPTMKTAFDCLLSLGMRIVFLQFFHSLASRERKK